MDTEEVTEQPATECDDSCECTKCASAVESMRDGFLRVMESVAVEGVVYAKRSRGFVKRAGDNGQGGERKYNDTERPHILAYRDKIRNGHISIITHGHTEPMATESGHLEYSVEGAPHTGILEDIDWVNGDVPFTMSHNLASAEGREVARRVKEGKRVNVSWNSFISHCDRPGNLGNCTAKSFHGLVTLPDGQTPGFRSAAIQEAIESQTQPHPITPPSVRTLEKLPMKDKHLKKYRIMIAGNATEAELAEEMKSDGYENTEAEAKKLMDECADKDKGAMENRQASLTAEEQYTAFERKLLERNPHLVAAAAREKEAKEREAVQDKILDFTAMESVAGHNLKDTTMFPTDWLNGTIKDILAERPATIEEAKGMFVAAVKVQAKAAKESAASEAKNKGSLNAPNIQSGDEPGFLDLHAKLDVAANAALERTPEGRGLLKNAEELKKFNEPVAARVYEAAMKKYGKVGYEAAQVAKHGRTDVHAMARFRDACVEAGFITGTEADNSNLIGSSQLWYQATVSPAILRRAFFTPTFPQVANVNAGELVNGVVHFPYLAFQGSNFPANKMKVRTPGVSKVNEYATTTSFDTANPRERAFAMSFVEQQVSRLMAGPLNIDIIAENYNQTALQLGRDISQEVFTEISNAPRRFGMTAVSAEAVAATEIATVASLSTDAVTGLKILPVNGKNILIDASTANWYVRLKAGSALTGANIVPSPLVIPQSYEEYDAYASLGKPKVVVENPITVVFNKAGAATPVEGWFDFRTGQLKATDIDTSTTFNYAILHDYGIVLGKNATDATAADTERPTVTYKYTNNFSDFSVTTSSTRSLGQVADELLQFFSRQTINNMDKYECGDMMIPVAIVSKLIGGGIIAYADAVRADTQRPGYSIPDDFARQNYVARAEPVSVFQTSSLELFSGDNMAVIHPRWMTNYQVVEGLTTRGPQPRQLSGSAGEYTMPTTAFVQMWRMQDAIKTRYFQNRAAGSDAATIVNYPGFLVRIGGTMPAMIREFSQ